MKKLMLLFALSGLFFLSCDYESSEKTRTESKLRTTQDVKEATQKAERERIELANRILKNLRKPKIIESKQGSSLDEKLCGPYPEAGLSSSLGLGGSIGGSRIYEIEIQHTDDEILKCCKDIAEHLPEIYKNSKYSKVQEEIIRILKMINLEDSIKPLIALASNTNEYSHVRVDIVKFLTTMILKFGTEEYTILMVPFLDDKDESIVSAVHELLRELKSKTVLEVLNEKYKAEYWGTKQLNLLYTIAEIDPWREADLIAYIKKVFKLLYTDRLGLRLEALKIIGQRRDRMFLDLILECFNNAKYKNREDFIIGMGPFYDDRRVKQLFKQILQSDLYSLQSRMAVVRFFIKHRDNYVNTLIYKIADQEMAKKYERENDNYHNVSDCLDALEINGDEATIKELQKLRVKHEEHVYYIDCCIKAIKKRLSE